MDHRDQNRDANVVDDLLLLGITDHVLTCIVEGRRLECPCGKPLKDCDTLKRMMREGRL